MIAVLLLGLLPMAIWAGLILGHGGFWKADQRDDDEPPLHPRKWPRVVAVVPARDEAQSIGPVIASLLAQDYGAGTPGSFVVTLVDDNSTDGTAERAGRAPNLKIVRGAPKPTGSSISAAICTPCAG